MLTVLLACRCISRWKLCCYLWVLMCMVKYMASCVYAGGIEVRIIKVVHGHGVVANKPFRLELQTVTYSFSHRTFAVSVSHGVVSGRNGR